MQRIMNQAALGGQGYLILSAVPATAERSLVNKRLIDAGALTVAGDYYCDVDSAGLASECYVHLKATFAGGSSTSDVYTTYKDGTTSYQGFTGDGAMVTTVLQTSTLTTMKGEPRVRVKLTLAPSPSVTFTQAEYNGK